MTHRLSPDDCAFRESFESFEIPPGDFDHRAHVRLAYAYLAENDPDTALESLRSALHGFLRHHEIDPSKYHETMTRAWILAVHHFMQISSPASSSEAFIAANPMLLDTRIMMTHYSAEVLFSEEARQRFVDPDLDPIPRYARDLEPRRQRKE